MAEAGAIKGRELRSKARRIWFRASRDCHGDVKWFDFVAPQKSLVVDVTVTSACTNSNVWAVGALHPLRGIMVLDIQQAKLYADLCTSSSLGTPSFHSLRL
jgi:hypothetical protein